jgi:hypothetical protein
MIYELNLIKHKIREHYGMKNKDNRPKGGNWMPLIVFRCTSCHRMFQEFVSDFQVASITNTPCPRCGRFTLLIVPTHTPTKRQRRKTEYGGR